MGVSTLLKALCTLGMTLMDGKQAFQAFKRVLRVKRHGRATVAWMRHLWLYCAWLTPSLSANLAHVMEWLSSCVVCNGTHFAEDTVRVVTRLYLEPMGLAASLKKRELNSRGVSKPQMGLAAFLKKRELNIRGASKPQIGLAAWP